MTQKEVSKLKVGSKIKDCLGAIKVVVSIKDNILYELKWIDDKGKLSKGSEYQVPSHFIHDTLIEL